MLIFAGGITGTACKYRSFSGLNVKGVSVPSLKLPLLFETDLTVTA
jgi:hypothetical protein